MPSPNDLSNRISAANSLLQQDMVEHAENEFTDILRSHPRCVDAILGLVRVYEHRQQWADAASGYIQLGLVLIDERRLVDAEQSFQRCIALDPKNAEALSHLSLIAWETQQLDEAELLARRALESDPNHAIAWQAVGLIAARRFAFDEAISALHTALQIQPDLILAHNHLGVALKRIGKIDAALDEFETVLRLQPDNPFAHFNRATIWLSQNRFDEGWTEYEWRFLTGEVKRPTIPRPRWDGSPTVGKTIMVHTEQGMGDVLQFVRLMPLLKQRGFKTVMACPDRLRPLLQRCDGIDAWFPIDQPAEVNFDLYAPLLSLPGLLEITLGNCPCDVPYVHADPDKSAHARNYLGALPGRKVGICWQGSTTYSADALRSIPLQRFAILADIPNVTLVSLQKGPGEEHMDSAENQSMTIHRVDKLDDGSAAFEDTAGLVQYLDLVITTDTAIAHLAGAMGRPVWVPLSTAADWRWGHNRQDSPWYPTMKLFRQSTPGDWENVFTSIATNLKEISR
ncbi:MAG: tetratricopeptide repeat protein [Pirellulaceae bacterium]|nr:tetratricopeptide repeat protein [Pirellulaceae bacterium]